METSVGEDLLMFAPGTVVAGRYEIKKHLGAGGMGTVVLTTDRALDNEPVALKFLFPHLVKDEILFARFRNEVLLTRKLSHPNIVSLYDFGRSEGGYYFISMEYIEGQNLRKRIYDRKRDRLKFKEILRILHDISSALKHAHNRGTIHRDLKPDNILISDFGDVKVMDFGLARSLWIDKGLTETGNAVGTPQYMAPEQIRGDDLDVRVDIYAVGIMAYEMVTGNTPFNAEGWFELAAQHMREPIPSFATKENGIPEWYEDFVFKCCEKKREARYSSFEEIIELLEEHMGQDEETDIRYTPAVLSLYTKDQKRRRRRRWKRRARYAATLGAFAAAGLIVAGALVATLKYVPSVNKSVSSLVLRAENATGAELTGLKNLLGTNLNLDKKEFFERVAVGEADAVSTLLAAGLSPNIRDESGQSVLEHAIDLGHKDVVVALLKGGVDMNAGAKGGLTPLMQAVQVGEMDILRVLVSGRPELNARDDRGMTALMHAAKLGEEKAAQVLIDAGAFVNPKDAFGETALQKAVAVEDDMLVRLLLDNKADPNVSDEKGETPLMVAARAKNKDLVELLVDYGADVSVKNKAGKAARDMVSRRSNRDIWKLVSEKRAAKKNVFVSRGGEGAASKDLQLTRLRARGKVRGTWRAVVGGMRLTNVKARVKNVGEVSAEAVVINAVLPDGSKLRLHGPDSVSRNSTEVYEAEADKVLRGSGELELEISCKNCRN